MNNIKITHPVWITSSPSLLNNLTISNLKISPNLWGDVIFKNNILKTK